VGKYTSEQLDWFLDNGHVSRDELTKMFNQSFDGCRTISAIRNICVKLGLKAKNNGGRFKKGTVPHNKGVTGFYYGINTAFKKGNRPKTARHVGSTRFSKDGHLYVKVAEPRKWRPVHVVIWESVNGEIPKGHVVVFIDGSDQAKASPEIENLEMITRSELLQRNRLKHSDMPSSIKPTTRLMAKVIDASISLNRSK